MSRSDIVRALAPAAPPCFASRLDWLEYLYSGAAAQNEKGQPMPLIFEAGKPVRFNYALDYCGDCSEPYQQVMAKCGRCNPTHLHSLAELIDTAGRELDGGVG